MQIQNPGLFNPENEEEQNFRPQENAVQKGQENISMPNDPQIRVPDMGKYSSQNPVEKSVDEQGQDGNVLYGIPVSGQEWDMISNAASQAENPEEELQRYAAAMSFSREYNLPISTTMQNLDELTEYQLGQKFKPTPTLFKSLQNSFKVAGITQDQTGLIEQWQDADRAGNEEEVLRLAQQIEQMDQELYSLKDDTPRRLATTFVKAAIENTPFMLDVAGSGMKWGIGTYLTSAALLNAAGLAFTPLTGGGSLATTAAITAAGATQVGQAYGSIQRTKDIMGSRVYYDLRKNGVDKNTSEVASQISGTIGGIVEIALDPLSGYLMGKTGGNTVLSTITSKVTSKIVSNGKLGAFVRGAASMGMSAVGEGSEEFIQSLTDNITSEIAYEISDVVPPERSMSMIRQAVEEGVQGFGVGLITGGVLGSINIATGRSQMNIDMQQAAAIKRFAGQVPSKETFVKTMDTQKPEGVKSADWSEAMSKIWDNNRKGSAEAPSSIETDETAINELDTGESTKRPTGRVRRTEAGELYTRESSNVTTDTQGVEHHSMLVGDPATGARYGHIDYAIQDNTIEIEDVKVRDGYEGIRKESVTSLMRQYEGYEFQWDAKGENLQSLRDQIIQENPLGSDAGLQYFDGVTNVDERLKLESMVGEAMPNLNASEKSVAATILQLRAESKGMSVDGYISTYGRDGKLFGNAKTEGVNLEGMRGATSFENTAEGVRAIIYAGERGDFSTFTHEAFHVFRREMEQTPQLQQAFIEASQTDELKAFIDDHRQLFNDETFRDFSAEEIAGTLSEFGESWTRTQEEAAARLWEGYLLDGKTSSSKLKNIFRRIAEWMSRVYGAMRGKVQLDQRIVDVFDSLLDSDSPIAQAARTQQARTRQSGMAAQYQGEQLYQVSAYHGSPYSFDRFSLDAIGTGEGAQAFGWGLYFTDVESIARHYANTLSARNDQIKLDTSIDNLSWFYNDEWQNIVHSIFSGLTDMQDAVHKFMESVGSRYEQAKEDVPFFESRLQEIIDNNEGQDTYDLVHENYEAAKLAIDQYEVLKREYDNGDLKVKKNQRNLYKVSLHEGKKPSDYTWLEWYDDIDRDNPAIKEVLEQAEKNQSWTNHFKKWIAVEYPSFAKDFNTLNSSQKAMIVDDYEQSTGRKSNVEFRLETGEDLYRKVQSMTGSEKEASLFLLRNGIDGIRYPADSLSGNPNSPGYNYVVFDENAVTIEEQILFQPAPPTDSEAFKKWFGNSKVVDENGDPMVVKHGTDEEFSEFNDEGSYDNLGFYFTDDINIAASYSQRDTVGDYYLSLKNPKIIDAKGLGWREIGNKSLDMDFDYVLTGFDKDGKLVEEFHDFSTDWEQRAEELGLSDAEAILAEDFETQSTRDIAWQAKQDGYDGVIIKNVIDIGEYGGGGESTVFIAFSPTQIKSVNNLGTWDAENPNILYQPAPPEGPQRDAWFEGSKAVDEQGNPLKLYHGSAQPVINFDSKLQGANTQANSAKLGIFFTPNKMVAEEYADVATPKKMIEMRNRLKELENQMKSKSISWSGANADWGNPTVQEYWELSDEIDATEWDAMTDATNAVMEANLVMKNPLIVDENGRHWKESNYTETIQKAISEGYDSVMIKNTNDPVNGGELVYDQYIVFDDSQIGVTQYYSIDNDYNQNILFQNAIDNALETAKQFDTWEEFKESYVMDAGFDFSIELPDNDQWYIDVFNEAHGIDENRADDTPTSRVRIESENQKDQWFIDHLQDDENIRKFLQEIGRTITFKNHSFTPADADEQAEYERLVNLRETIPSDVHPIITANAYRAASNKNITPKSMKSIRTMMTGQAIRYYRDLYAEVMKDEDVKPEVIDARLPDIDELGYDELENLSITERLRLADEIESAALKKKILSGKETIEGDAEKVIRTMDRQIQKLQERIEKSEQEIEESQEGMNDQERKLSLLYKKLTDAQSALEKEIKDVSKKTKTDPSYRADNARRYSLNSQIEDLHEQIKKLRASDKVKATAKRHEALSKLKKELTDKQNKREEARKVREYKTKLARNIMAKPAKTIDWEYAQKIYTLQAVIDPRFRQSSVNVEGENVRVDYLSDIIAGENEKEIREAIGDMRYEELSDILGGSTEEDLRNALGDRVYERVVQDRKPLNDWTISELEEIAEEIATLREEGRNILAAKDERKRAIADRYRRAIEQQLLTSGKYKPRPLYGSIDDQKEREKFSEKVKRKFFSTIRIEEQALILDGGMNGVARELLVDKRRELQNQEARAIEERMRPIEKIMTRKGKEITLKDLYGDIEITIDGQKSKVHRMYLAYAWLSQYNPQNRAAVAYGELVKKDEKHIHFNEDNYLIQQVGDKRYQQLIDQARYHLFDMDESGKYFDFIKAIRDDLNAQSPRINEVSVREFNEQMRSIDNYLPIHRQSVTGEEMEERIKDDLLNANAGGMPTSVEQGFKQQRVSISPLHQSEVNMDLFGVWQQSMRDHEHFIHFAEYGRLLNRVFKNQNTTSTKDIISQSLGSGFRDKIEQYINEVINPQAFQRLDDSEKMFKMLRGNLGPAYLAWKSSGIVLQGITSPMPFFSDVHPLRMIKAYMDITHHPMEAWDFITEKSVMMKNRSMNIILEELLEKSKQFHRHWISRFNVSQQEVGMMGLTLIDRWSVMGGWMGAYQQKLAELDKQGVDTETADKKAVKYADDVVLRVQPTGDKLDMAPMFKNGSEAWKAVTQFQASLNVIWNNLVVDVPYMVKNATNKELPLEVRKREYARAIGQITGYVLAGALLGAVAEGHDDNDDDREKFKNWLYWSTTQFTAAIPLFGDGVNSIIEAQLKDESPYFFQDNFMPAIDNVLKGVSDIGQEEYKRALKNLSEGFGMYFGAPVSGTKEIYRIIKEEGPEAALGRRDYK